MRSRTTVWMFVLTAAVALPATAKATPAELRKLHAIRAGLVGQLERKLRADAKAGGMQDLALRLDEGQPEESGVVGVVGTLGAVVRERDGAFDFPFLF